MQIIMNNDDPEWPVHICTQIRLFTVIGRFCIFDQITRMHTEAQFQVTVIKLINLSVAYFTLRLNVNFGCFKCLSVN